VEVRHRSTLVLSDPDDPATQQPYHAGFGQLEENPAVLRARIARVRRAAHASVRAMLRACRASALDITGAGVVVGSTIDPDSIGNPHIRAHALEGRLFRTVVEESLAAAGLVSRVIVERKAFAAASFLSRSDDDLKRALNALGRGPHGSVARRRKTRRVGRLDGARSRAPQTASTRAGHARRQRHPPAPSGDDPFVRRQLASGRRPAKPSTCGQREHQASVRVGS